MKLMLVTASVKDARMNNVIEFMHDCLGLDYSTRKTDWLVDDEGHSVKYTLSRERQNYTLRVYYDPETISSDEFIKLVKESDSYPNAKVRSYFTGNNDYYSDDWFQMNVDISSMNKYDSKYIEDVMYNEFGVFLYKIVRSTYDSVTYETESLSDLGDSHDIEQQIENVLPDYSVKYEENASNPRRGYAKLKLTCRN